MMATQIEIKYDNMRSFIKEGDVILFHGTGIILRLIQWFDNAYWNHVGIVIECSGSLGICDANGNGVQWDRLSWRVKQYSKGGDFVIIRPIKDADEIQKQLRMLLYKSDKKWVKYDYVNGFKELFNRKFGFKFKIILSDDKVICSSNDAKYVINLGIITEDFKNIKIQFPQDYIRYINLDKAKIFGI